MDLAKHNMLEQVKDKEQKLESSEENVAKQATELDSESKDCCSGEDNTVT